MNGATKRSRLPARRLAVRAALVAVYLGLAALVFVLGKGHTVLLDNKDADDGAVAAFDGVMVTVDRQEALEMYRGDRLRAAVAGQSHTVTVEPFPGGTKVTKKIRVPIGEDMVLLSLPMLAAGLEPALVPYVAPQAPPAPPAAEEAEGEDEASGGEPAGD